MKRFLLMLSMVLLATTLLACSQSTANPGTGQEVKVTGGSYRNITPVELNSMLEKKDFLLVNVHVPYEGEIPQTDLFVPFNEIEQNLDKFPNKGGKIVVYCRSGSMSATAAEALVGQGYTNVWNLNAGMKDWENQGYELIRK